jgi:hypothetical protein
VHGFGLQTPADVQMLGSAQFVWVVSVQVPSGAQHAPVGGCWHGFGAQVPNMVQVPVQADSSVTAHVPSG